MIHKNYIKSNNAFYKDRLQSKSSNIEILSSGNSERRETRFTVLTQIGIQNHDSILDIGCGFGDFYKFLVGHEFLVDYHGVDISGELIEAALTQHKTKTEAQHNRHSLGASFETRDFLTEKFHANSFDFVICSQVLNLQFENSDNLALAKSFMKESLKIARKGVAIDFISNYVDYKEDYLHYFSPEELFSYAKSLTKRVSLRHDYPAFEFTLYLYPDFDGWN